MSRWPEFPTFKPLDLDDRDLFNEVIKAYKPEMSELTFTNLFAWRAHYRFEWTGYGDSIFITGKDEEDNPYAMSPIGPSSRREMSLVLLRWMKERNPHVPARIERADKRLVEEVSGLKDVRVEPLREHFDYVYLRTDLVELAGNRYRSKRNHINKLLRSYSSFSYEPLGKEHVMSCLELQESWCTQRRCEDDLSLMGEWEAIREILANYELFDLKGGVVLMDGKVLAFTIGERLNEDTAVVHIEKADGDVPGLYSIVNQQCCEKCWPEVSYINREQDLGMAGLREAKMSYYPHHFVEKFRITLE